MRDPETFGLKKDQGKQVESERKPSSWSDDDSNTVMDHDDDNSVDFSDDMDVDESGIDGNHFPSDGEKDVNPNGILYNDLAIPNLFQYVYQHIFMIYVRNKCFEHR